MKTAEALASLVQGQGQSVLGAGLGTQGTGVDILLGAHKLGNDLAHTLAQMLQSPPPQPEKPLLPFDLATVAEALYDKQANLGHNLGGALGHALALGVAKQNEAISQQQAEAQKALQQNQSNLLNNLLELVKAQTDIGKEVGRIGGKVSERGQELVDRGLAEISDLAQTTLEQQVEREDIAERARKAFLSFRLGLLQLQRKQKEYNWVPDFISSVDKWMKQVNKIWTQYQQGQVDLMSAVASLAAYNKNQLKTIVEAAGNPKAKKFIETQLRRGLDVAKVLMNPAFLDEHIRQRGRVITSFAPVPVRVRDADGNVHNLYAIEVSQRLEKNRQKYLAYLASQKPPKKWYWPF